MFHQGGHVSPLALLAAGLPVFCFCLCAGDNANPAKNGSASEFPYEKVDEKRWAKLKAIRDSYGSISNLDSLYKNRTHPNGLPYHIYVPKMPGSDFQFSICHTAGSSENADARRHSRLNIESLTLHL